MKSFISPRQILPLLGLAIVLAAALWLLPSILPHPFNGTLLDPAQPGSDFSLPSTLGKPLALSELRGKVVLIYFGYTFCPDICPATLGSLKTVLQTLGSQADRVEVLLVSVDPQRDTLDRMQTYLKNFDPVHMVGLSGDLETTRTIAKAYGIFFQAQLPNEAGAYAVDHTSAVLLIDARGSWREVFSYGTPPNAIAQDVDYMLSH